MQEKWVSLSKGNPPAYEVVEVRFVVHDPGTRSSKCLYEGTAYYREIPENRRMISSGWVFHKLRFFEEFDFLGRGLEPTHWRRIKQ